MALIPTYYKRYRMEIDLTDLPPVTPLPPRFEWRGWPDCLPAEHAAVKFASFRGCVDAEVFDNFATLEGCQRLVETIRANPGFCPGATWLIDGPHGPCGAVQALVDQGVGAIQNVGVVPAVRGLGVGRALVLRALHAFRDRGLYRGALDVTARNISALRLYRRLGFYVVKTSYRLVHRQAIDCDVVF